MMVNSFVVMVCLGITSNIFSNLASSRNPEATAICPVILVAQAVQVRRRDFVKGTCQGIVASISWKQDRDRRRRLLRSSDRPRPSATAGDSFASTLREQDSRARLARRPSGHESSAARARAFRSIVL